MLKSARKCSSFQLLISAFLVASLVLLGTSNVDASSSPTIWDKLYGGELDDEAAAIVQTGDGGYVIAGTTYSFGAGSADFWLVKTDANGNVGWTQTYGGQEDEYACSMVQTSDGGYALAGETYSFGAGDSDFWLIKVDSSGSIQWNKTYGEPTADGANSVIQTSDGGYAMAGYSTDKVTGRGFWFVKTDSSGNMQWNRTYGGSRWDDAESVIQTGDRGYALAGTTNSFSDDIPHDCWLVKTDLEGNMEWNKTYDGDGGFDGANSLVQTSDGGYTLAGHTGGFIGQNVWVIKTDSDGNRIWDVIWDTAEPTRTSCMIQTSDGGYAITGWTESLDGFAGFSSYLFLVKVDLNGNIQWNSTYTGLGDSKALFAVQTDDGYALAGTTRSTDEDAHYDIWFAKVDSSGEDIPEFPTWTTSYIRADGSVEGTDKIQIDGDVYTFISDINGSIVVEKDSIVINGANFTLQGNGSGTGIDLSDRYNVTVKNMQIMFFSHGIFLPKLNNTFFGNIVTNNTEGFWLLYCSNNTITWNTIINNQQGINLFFSSSNNIISENNMINNLGDIIIWLEGEGNIIDRNYWSKYNGTDNNGDGIGDTPHIFFENYQDHNPLMKIVVIPEFPSWTPLLIMLVTVMAVAVIYRRSLHKHDRGRRNQ